MNTKASDEKALKQDKSDAKIDKRKLIMDAAMELFKEKGYTNTRIIDIANKAEIGKGTVYAYFDSKEDLMIKLIREIVQTDFKQLMFTYGVGSTREKIIKYIVDTDKLIDKYGLYATIFRDQIMLNSDVNSDEAVELVQNISQGQYNKLRNIIQEGIDSGEIKKVDLNQATLYAITAIGAHMANKLSEMDNCCVPVFLKTGDLKGLSVGDLVDFIFNGIGA